VILWRRAPARRTAPAQRQAATWTNGNRYCQQQLPSGPAVHRRRPAACRPAGPAV